jgi:hypothetical protein
LNSTTRPRHTNTMHRKRPLVGLQLGRAVEEVS